MKKRVDFDNFLNMMEETLERINGLLLQGKTEKAQHRLDQALDCLSKIKKHRGE